MSPFSGNNASRIFDLSNATQETISNLTFINGKAPGTTEPHPGEGGALYSNVTTGFLALNNDTFDNNTAEEGGAVYALGATLTATGCHFNTNTATTDYGGAIEIPAQTPGETVILDGCGFTGNTAQVDGGGIYASGEANTTLQVIHACVFNNNKAIQSNGGAIYTTDQLTVTGSSSTAISFSGNNAMAGAGGAVAYVDIRPGEDASSSISLTNVAFTGNEAALGGAVDSAVIITQGTVTATVTGCLFTGNPALQSGGAIIEEHDTSGTGSASFTVTNSTFYENSAISDGGALNLDNSNTGMGTNTVALTSLTVDKNTAGSAGGGIWIDPDMIAGLRVNIWNSIVAEDTINNAASNGPDIFGVNTILSKGYNLIGITDGTFTNPNNYPWLGSDYKGTASSPLPPGLNPNGPTDNGGPTKTITLLNGSPAYHHGDSQNLGGTKDQRGYTRPPKGTPISIGAYDPDAIAPPP
jgi:predicted outer membrane repeat protein